MERAVVECVNTSMTRAANCVTRRIERRLASIDRFVVFSITHQTRGDQSCDDRFPSFFTALLEIALRHQMRGSTPTRKNAQRGREAIESMRSIVDQATTPQERAGYLRYFLQCYDNARDWRNYGRTALEYIDVAEGCDPSRMASLALTLLGMPHGDTATFVAVEGWMGECVAASGSSYQRIQHVRLLVRLGRKGDARTALQEARRVAKEDSDEIEEMIDELSRAIERVVE